MTNKVKLLQTNGKLPIYIYTTSATVPITQAGGILTNEGATADIALTLPVADPTTKGAIFYVSVQAPYRMTFSSTSSAFRYSLPYIDSTLGASNVYNRYQYATFTLRNDGEFSTFGRWIIIPQVGLLNS